MKNNKWKSIIIVWISILGLVTGVQVVQKNQENRSNAASEPEIKTEVIEINDFCGSSNGLSVSSRPIENLCKIGSAIWTDSVASEGEYGWVCTDGSNESQCGAFLKD